MKKVCIILQAVRLMSSKEVTFVSSTKKVIGRVSVSTWKQIETNVKNASKFISIRNYKKAALYYKKILKSVPNFYPALNGLAYIYFSKGDFEKAIYYAEKALSIDKENIYALSILAEVYTLFGIIKKAKEYLDEALKLIEMYSYDVFHMSKLIEAVVFYGDYKLGYRLFNSVGSAGKNDEKIALAAGVSAINLGYTEKGKELLRTVFSSLSFTMSVFKILECAKKLNISIPPIGHPLANTLLLNLFEREPLGNYKLLLRADGLKAEKLGVILRSDRTWSEKRLSIFYLVATKDPEYISFLKEILRCPTLPSEVKDLVVLGLFSIDAINLSDELKYNEDKKEKVKVVIDRIVSKYPENDLPELEELIFMLDSFQNFSDTVRTLEYLKQINDAPLFSLLAVFHHILISDVNTARRLFEPIESKIFITEQERRLYYRITQVLNL